LDNTRTLIVAENSIEIKANVVVRPSCFSVLRTLKQEGSSAYPVNGYELFNFWPRRMFVNDMIKEHFSASKGDPKMSQDTKLSIEIFPTIGWASVRLGQSIDEVQTAVTKLGFSLEVTNYDKFKWCADEPGVSFQFVDEKSPRLANITLGDGPMIVNGIELLGLRIDEALMALGIKSFSDTMWSIMDPEDELENGTLMPDAEQPTNSDSIELLRYGTLWIHSLGLGLSMNNAHVGQVAIRHPSDTPKMGCGPLTEEMLLTATDPKFEETVEAIRAEFLQKSKHSSAPIHWATRLVLTAIALGMICLPVYLMYRNYSRWSSATQVTGKVVALTPETFPDFVTVEYSEVNEQVHRVELSANYVHAREIGAEVDLLYTLDDPGNPVTLSQRYDAVLAGFSPYLLVISPTMAIFLFAWAYPEWTHKRTS
jgi:hypothetical protein